MVGPSKLPQVYLYNLMLQQPVIWDFVENT